MGRRRRDLRPSYERRDHDFHAPKSRRLRAALGVRTFRGERARSDIVIIESSTTHTAHDSTFIAAQTAPRPKKPWGGDYARDSIERFYVTPSRAENLRLVVLTSTSNKC